MTETVRRFPRTTRVAVVAALLGVVSLVTTVAGAAPSKEDVERARARLEGIEDKLGGIQRQLAATQEQLNAATAKVERHEAAVEQITAELIRTQEELDRARASYERVSTRLNERAAAAYMTGPASSIDFLLNAQNVADLTDRIAYVDALAQADAELAVKVANEKNRLVALEAELEEEQLRRSGSSSVRGPRRERWSRSSRSSRACSRHRSNCSPSRSGRSSAPRRAMRIGSPRSRPRPATRWRPGVARRFPRALRPCLRGLSRSPAARLRRRVRRSSLRGWLSPAQGGRHRRPTRDRDTRPVRRSVVHELERPGRERGVRGGVAGHRVQRAPVELLRELERRRLGRRGRSGSSGTPGSSTTPHDHFEFHPHTMPGDWYRSFYGYGASRTRSTRTLAAAGLRLPAPARLLSWSRCDPRTSDTWAWWARV